MTNHPTSGGSLEPDRKTVTPSPMFLEAVTRGEARRILICSIGQRWGTTPEGIKLRIERFAVSERTSPSAIADIGARLNVEIEVIRTTDTEIRELIERVYDAAENPEAR